MKKIIMVLIMSLIITGSSIKIFADEMQEVTTENEVGKITVATTIQTTADGQYTFSTTSDNSVLIRKYQGTDGSVTVPAVFVGMDGKSYNVGYIGNGAFRENKTLDNVVISDGIKEIGNYAFKYAGLKSLVIPSTIYYIGLEAFGYASNLERVTVSKDSQYFYDIDGVLYEKNCYDGGTALVVYPPMKTGESYVVPEGVKVLMFAAFDSPKYLKELVLPSSLTGDVWDSAIYKPDNPMTIYVKVEEIAKFFKGTFCDLPLGSKVIVKNSIVAGVMPEKLKNCEDTEIISLTEKGEYARYASDLTFTDGTITKNVTLGRGETYFLTGCFIQMPKETTENITWSSTDKTVAYFDNIKGMDLITTSVLNFKGGTCQIVGTDESGHKIYINIYAYEPVTEMSLIYGGNRQSSGDLEVGLNENDAEIGVAAYVSTYYANHAKDVIWSSSDMAVAIVESYGNSEYGNQIRNYGLITTKKAGTTIITATINDDDNIISKQFILTVKSANGNDDGDIQNANELEKKLNLDMSKVKWTATKLFYNGKNQSVTLTGLPEGATASYRNGTKKAAGKYTAEATISYDSTKYNTPVKIVYTSTWYICDNQSITFKSKNVKNGIITVPYGTSAFQLSANAKTAVLYGGGNKKIATVDSSGMVIIRGTGCTTITVSAKPSDVYSAAEEKIVVYVVPKQGKITSLKSNKQSQMTMKWNKEKVAGYQIQYSKNSSFNIAKSVMVSGNKGTSKTIKNLEKGKNYYVRIRSYMVIKEGTKSVKKYGTWSNLKSVMIKKK